MNLFIFSNIANKKTDSKAIKEKVRSKVRSKRQDPLSFIQQNFSNNPNCLKKNTLDFEILHFSLIFENDFNLINNLKKDID